MRKRNIALILSFFILLVFFLYRPLRLVRLPFIPISVYEAVPAETALILEFNGYKNIEEKLQKNGYETNLQNIDLIQHLKKDLNLLDTIFNNDPTFISLSQENRLLASLALDGAADLNFLYILDIDQVDLDMYALVNKLGNAKIKKSNFRNVDVLNVEWSKGESFALCRFKNLLLMGSYALLVEDGIEQLKQLNSNICKQKGFRKIVKKGNSNAEASLLINFQNLSNLLSVFVKSKKKKDLLSLKGLATWSRFDLEFQKEGIKSNGFFIPFEKNILLAAANKQSSVNRNGLAAIVPDHVALMTSFSTPDFSFFHQNLFKGDSDFENYFVPWIGEEMVYTITEPYSSNLSAEKFILFKTKDMDLSQHYLQKFGEQTGELKNYEYQTYNIKQILYKDMLKSVFGEQFNPIQNPYYTYIEDYIVFCNSQQALEIWIDKYISGQTLSRDLDYLKQSKHLSDRANIFMYFNPSHLLPMLKIYARSNIKESIDQSMEALKGFNPMTFCFTSSGKNFISEAYMEQKSAVTEQTEIMWKTNLAKKVAIPPSLVKNTKNNQFEIFVQDEDHQTYLMNRGGEILWTRKIEGKILSEISQIDYYKNGELQYLFNTSFGIYLIDRKGRDVSSFPIRLQSPASNGVKVIDFNHNKNYSFFVACENGNVYGFEKNGKPIAGWNPKLNVGSVKYPIGHFQKEAKDFVFILTESGELKTFKSDGEPRFSMIDFESMFLSAPDFQVLDSYSRIVAGDVTGRVYAVNLEGGFFPLQMNLGKNNQAKFVFADVLGDKRNDYVGLDSTRLVVYTYEDKFFTKKIDYQFKETQNEIFVVQKIDRQRNSLGTLNKIKKQINLIEANGNLHPDFPLAGTTPYFIADLFDHQKNILVVGFEDSIYAYQLK